MAVYDVLDSTGAIVNRIVLEDPEGWTVPEGCTIQLSDNSPWRPTESIPIPPSVPRIISDRQFFQQLALQSVITQDDALAAVKTGTLPPSLVQLVSGLPADQQFGANMLLCGATTFDRQNQMVAVLGQAFGWNDAQLDALWTAASAL